MEQCSAILIFLWKLSISVFGASFENHLGFSSFSEKNSHSENRFGSFFFLFKKNFPFWNFPWFSKNVKIQLGGLRSMGFTIFWTTDFQAQFSQVNYHKSRFLFFIYIYIIFWVHFCFLLWMENGKYDCPLKQTSISFQQSRLTCK